MKAGLLLVSLLFCSTLAAQALDKGDGLRDKIMQVQMGQIISGLKLDGQRSEQFQAIYIRYFNEMAATESKPDNYMRADSITDAQAEQAIQGEFAAAKKSLHIREKYYDEFRSVLSPSEIYRMYAIERQVRRRVMQESGHRMGQNSQGGAVGTGYHGPQSGGGYHGAGGVGGQNGYRGPRSLGQPSGGAQPAAGGQPASK